MRRLSFRALPALLAMVLFGSAGEAQDSPVDMEAFLERERELFRALFAKERDALESVLAEDFVSRGAPDVDRATWIENAIDLCWGDASEIESFDARAMGETETVVASFVVTTYQDPETCEYAILRSLVTDVWVRREGRWRLAVRHSGPVGEAGVGRQFEAVELPPPRWEVTAELSAVATAGNADTETLGAAGELYFRPESWITAFRTAFVRSEAESVENAQSLTVELRQSRTLSDRLEAFGRVGFLQDRFAGIDARVSTDGGIAYQLLALDAHSLKVDAGVGYTREERLAGADRSFAIANTVADYEWSLSETTSVTNEATFTASLEEGEDWRFSDRLALRAEVTDLFAVKLSYSLKFLNLPVEGFQKTDTVLSAALVATFTRR